MSRPRVSIPTQHLDVHDLWESDEDNLYKTQDGYLPVEASENYLWLERKRRLLGRRGTRKSLTPHKRIGDTKPKRAHNKPWKW